MPFKDADTRREYQREYKRDTRDSYARKRQLHAELGIKTYVHMQAILHSPYGGRHSGGKKGAEVHAHWYRMPVTLAKVFA